MDLKLVHGVFLRRYKRFLADVELDGRVVTAHLPNTGSMATLMNPGVDAWLRPASNPARKLPFTLTLLGLPEGGLALVDTSLPNAVVAEGITTGAIPELSGYQDLRREVVYGSRGSRVDVLLTGPDRSPCYVEIKNVTMRSFADPQRADFPDAKTARGVKHLAELSEVVRAGGRAVQFYLLSRTDCHTLGIASDIDAAYMHALRQARAVGVDILVYQATISETGITVGTRCLCDFS